jgi:hypothetical protein
LIIGNYYLAVIIHFRQAPQVKATLRIESHFEKTKGLASITRAAAHNLDPLDKPYPTAVQPANDNQSNYRQSDSLLLWRQLNNSAH